MEFYSCLFGFVAGTLAGMILIVWSYIDKAKEGEDYTFIDGEAKWVDHNKKGELR